MEETFPLRDKRKKKGKEKIKKGPQEGSGKAKLVLQSVLLPGSFKPHPVFLSIKFCFFSECPEL